MPDSDGHNPAFEIGYKLRSLRKEKYPAWGGQTQCALDFGVSQSEWSRWENGTKIPSALNIRRLAKFFGISVEQLWGEEAKPVALRESALSEALQMNIELQQKILSYCHDAESGQALALCRTIMSALETFEKEQAREPKAVDVEPAVKNAAGHALSPALPPLEDRVHSWLYALATLGELGNNSMYEALGKSIASDKRRKWGWKYFLVGLRKAREMSPLFFLERLRRVESRENEDRLTWLNVRTVWENPLGIIMKDKDDNRWKLALKNVPDKSFALQVFRILDWLHQLQLKRILADLREFESLEPFNEPVKWLLNVPMSQTRFLNDIAQILVNVKRNRKQTQTIRRLSFDRNSRSGGESVS